MSKFRCDVLAGKGRSRGDTLVEVVMALAILSSVIGSCALLATKAFQLSQTARERTSISNEAQSQMEKVREFRDNRNWSKFLDGDSAAGYAGVINGATSSCQGVSATCFHMQQITTGGNQEHVPLGGGMPGSVPLSYIEVSAVPDAAAPVQSVEVTVDYGFASIGGVHDSLGHIKTKFTNLKFPDTGVAVGPPPPPPCVNAPKDIVLLLDASHSMSNLFPPASGTTRADGVKTSANYLIDNLSIGNGPSDNRMMIKRFVSFQQTTTVFHNNTGSLHADMNSYNYTGSVGTYFTPILNTTAGALGGTRPGAERIVILLSDGFITTVAGIGPPPPDTVSAARAAADNLKNNFNAKIFTIGVGINTVSDPNAIPLLQAISGNGGFYGDAPADLSNVTNALISVLNC